ncbi:MAG: LCP family protein [Elusimicrobiota bacterium]
MKMKTISFKQVLLLLCAAVILLSVYFSWTNPVATLIRNNRNINFVIVGTDWVDYARHSDTIIFLTYNPRKRLFDVISVPRDTRIELPGTRVKKINEVYAYYWKSQKNHMSALQAFCRVVSNVFQNRFDSVFYIHIDYTLFSRFIDILGGVKIDIEEPMHYTDRAGKLNINFDPGAHLLGGRRALEYVRFRGSAGDIGRIYRQQRFIRATLNRIRSPQTILRMPAILKFFTQVPNKNFGLWDMIILLFEIKNADFGNIRLAQLPGRFSGPYWLANETQINHVMDLILGPGMFETSKITVEVYNASGNRGVALDVTRQLRDAGFDVVDYGNYPTEQLKTIVVDRVGNLAASRSIAKAVNTEEIFTRYDSPEKRLADITVIIGREYGKHNNAIKAWSIKDK